MDTIRNLKAGGGGGGGNDTKKQFSAIPKKLIERTTSNE